MVWTFIWEKTKLVAFTDNKTNFSYMKDVLTKLHKMKILILENWKTYYLKETCISFLFFLKKSDIWSINQSLLFSQT